MGGLLHLFDFNQGSMARKLFVHKKHDGGLDAPRNSTELQVEPSQSYSEAGDFPVKEGIPKKNYPIESSMKKLIHEEISKHSSTRHHGPSIVARLMGMDMLPVDTKPAAQPIVDKHEYKRTKSSKKEVNGSSSVVPVSSNLNSSTELDLNSFYQNNGTDEAGWCEDERIEKPRREEHPQEEELQKFKREFEAYQSARFRECSRIVEMDSIASELHAQEDLNKKKTLVSSKSRQTAMEKTMEALDHTVRTMSNERGVLAHHVDKMDMASAECRRYLSSTSRTKSLDFEQSTMMNSRKSFTSSLAPTRIVILKPGPDSFCNHEETWISSPSALDQRGSIEDFLKEVKDRLYCELQGKVHKRSSVVRGSGIETPYSEQPSPKQIARHIANHVRDSVTRDLGVNLLRSESTRSYRSETQFNGSGSPEFLHRDTRKYLLERLRNVSERETEYSSPVLRSGSYRSSAVDYERIRVKQVADALEAQKYMSFYGRGTVKDDHVKSRSFRHGPDDDKLLDRELSPRNLIRSLSAPVSGTSFGKLLLENRHILTGAHIQRKLEATEHMSLDMKSHKKERFNFKQKVSNFRYSFTLRGRLFGKRIQSMTESRRTESYPINDIRSGPTVIMNSRERNDNFTEVPPSPASYCSPAHEEFCRTADCLSPISTANATPRDDRLMPQAFRDISDNLSELRRQLKQLESDEPEDAPLEHEVVESEMLGLENPAELFIRDLLVASGLYDGSFEKSFSRWDTFAKPISLSVFKEVEESYKKLGDEHGSSTKNHNEKVNHKLLLDLLNEALSTVLGPPINMSKFRRKAINFSVSQPLHGKKLLDCVWQTISHYLYPPNNRSYYSLDDIVSRDVGSAPWSALVDEVVNALGREMECLIMRDLIKEVLDDIQL